MEDFFRILVAVMLVMHGLSHIIWFLSAWTSVPTGVGEGSWILPGDITIRGRVGKALGLLALTIFLAASLLSYDPADPPSKLVFPERAETLNVCGRSGALVSRLLFGALGLGAYYLLFSLAALDAVLLTRCPINQAALRAGGWLLSLVGVAILVAIAWRHTGYIMVLYLAGLKSVDASLKESAALDGCNEWQSFRHVLFPTLKPINVVVAVITVIEALRAFDIIFVLNTPRRTQVLSILTTNNLLGEGGGNVGRGSAYAVILFLMCLGFVVWYVTNHYRQSEF